MEHRPPVYEVTEGKTSKLISIDPFEAEDIDCFNVVRVQSKMGWHVGRYADKQTADAVAAILTALADREV